MKYRIKMILAASLLMLSCSKEAEPISYGKDQCSHCKMTIMDNKYGTEIVDQKGKVFKFDDLVCLKNYISEKGLKDEGAQYYVSSYSNPASGFLNGRKAVFLKHPFFRSPMNGNIAAFASENEASRLKDSLSINYLYWDKL